MAGIQSPEITVIITVYNQSIEDLLFSTRSVLSQKDVSFEIIIADDCSAQSYETVLKEFFAEQGFSKYIYSRCEKNRQTVANILEAVSYASGEFVKCIGAGDSLYDAYTLHDIISFSKSIGLRVGFGRIVAFRHWNNQNKKFFASAFKAPTNAKSYGLNANNLQLLSHQLLKADWVPAPAQFFQTQYFINKLTALSKYYDIRYCEDFALTLALLDESERIFFLDRPVEWYEMGVGVSTSGNKDSVKKLYCDHSKLYKLIGRFSAEIESYRAAQLLYLIRRFIAIDTPFYRFFQKRLANNYMESNCSTDDNTPSQFFFDCRL